jgi:peptidoglycan/LPS O-acetylase OafA/YrhL
LSINADVFSVCATVAAFAVAHLLYLVVETPMTRRLNGLMVRRKSGETVRIAGA